MWVPLPPPLPLPPPRAFFVIARSDVAHVFCFRRVSVRLGFDSGSRGETGLDGIGGAASGWIPNLLQGTLGSICSDGGFGRA
jgi:hypothetical protein